MWFAVDARGVVSVFEKDTMARRHAETEFRNAVAVEDDGVEEICWGKVLFAVEPSDGETEPELYRVDDPAMAANHRALTDAIGCVRFVAESAEARGDDEYMKTLSCVTERLREIRSGVSSPSLFSLSLSPEGIVETDRMEIHESVVRRPQCTGGMKRIVYHGWLKISEGDVPHPVVTITITEDGFVEWIETDSRYRRKGYATEAMRAVEKLFEDVVMDGATPEGEYWVADYQGRDVPNAAPSAPAAHHLPLDYALTRWSVAHVRWSNIGGDIPYLPAFLAGWNMRCIGVTEPDDVGKYRDSFRAGWIEADEQIAIETRPIAVEIDDWEEHF